MTVFDNINIDGNLPNYHWPKNCNKKKAFAKMAKTTHPTGILPPPGFPGGRRGRRKVFNSISSTFVLNLP